MNLPEELKIALEDVQTIKSTIDKVKMSHPIRIFLRPMMFICLVFGPMIGVYGVAAQKIFQSEQTQFFSLNKSVILILLTFSMLLLSFSIKWTFFYIESKKKGYKLRNILNQMFFIDGYIRIVIAMLSFIFLICIVLANANLGHLTVGVIACGSGAIMLLIPLALPMSEFTPVSVYYYLTGIIALFFFPAYPFYKVGFIWGLGALLMAFITWKSLQKRQENE